MSWYVQEKIAERRQVELERALELKRQTQRARPLHYWLLTTIRTWIISTTH